MSHAAGRDQRAPSSAFPWFGNRAWLVSRWLTDTTLSGDGTPCAHSPQRVWQRLIFRPVPYALHSLSSALHEWCVACAGLRTYEAGPPGGAKCVALSATMCCCSSSHANGALLFPAPCRWLSVPSKLWSVHPAAHGGVAAVGIPGVSSDTPSVASSLCVWSR